MVMVVVMRTQGEDGEGRGGVDDLVMVMVMMELSALHYM